MAIESGQLSIVNRQFIIISKGQILSSVNRQIIIISKGKIFIFCYCVFAGGHWISIFLQNDANYTNYQSIDYPNVNERFNGTLRFNVTLNFLVKWYHGCDCVNRNRAKKLTDYQRGETCLLATNN